MFSHQLHKEKIRELTYSVSLKHGVNVVKQVLYVCTYVLYIFMYCALVCMLNISVNVFPVLGNFV